MKLSVIIPAYNEAKRIGKCLTSVRDALSANTRAGLETEIIVADNNSSDATPEIAASHGAQVVFEPVNQIARARNAGGMAATGDWLLFFDADSTLPAGAIKDMLSTIETGKYAGGGSTLVFDQAAWWLKGVIAIANVFFRMVHLTAGCFIFCRADAFREIGGFSRELFAAEDAYFGWDLRRWGKARGLQTTILRRHPPVTSSRKLELYSRGEMLAQMVRFFVFPRSSIRDRRHLRIYYDGRR